MLFVSFAAMTLLAGDIASYEGERLLREASVDLIASVVGAGITYFWITRALTRPIARLDEGMRLVAEGNLAVRLPVTSDDEVGRAISGFNWSSPAINIGCVGSSRSNSSPSAIRA